MSKRNRQNNQMQQTESIRTSTSNEKLATAVRWGIYICAFIPLIIFREYVSPFHFGKIMVFRPLVEIIAILYLALLLRDRSYLPKTNFIFWAVTGFIGAYGLATVTSVFQYQSFWGTLERMGGFFSMLHFWIFFVIMIAMLREERHWRLFLKISVMVAFVSVIYAITQKKPWLGVSGIASDKSPIVNYIVGFGIGRVFGTLGNTALFAGYVLVNIFFAIILLVRRTVEETRPRTYIIVSAVALMAGIFFWIMAYSGARPSGENIYFPHIQMLNEAFTFIITGLVFLLYLIRPIEKYFLVGFSILSVVMIIMTAVRGSIIAVIVAFVIFAILCFLSGARRLGLALIITGAVLCSLWGIAVAARNTHFVQSHSILLRLSDVSLKSKTVNTRFWAWRAGIDGWNDSFKTIIVGYGPENFNVPFSKHFNPKFYEGSGSETLFDRAHNMFVEILVTMGIVGFLTYLLVFASLLWVARKLWYSSEDLRGRLTASTIIAGLGAYSIHNAFIFDTSANLVVFFIMAGFVYYCDPDLKGVPSPGALSPRRLMNPLLGNVLVILAVLGMFVSAYMTSVRPVEANYSFTRGYRAYWGGDLVRAIDKHKEAINYDTFGVYDYRHKYQQFLLENISRIQRDPEYSGPDAKTHISDLLLEGAEFVKNNFAFKDDYLPYLYLARTYIVLGSGDPTSPFNDLALEMVTKALEVSPTFIRSYYELAQVYINKNDLDRAINTFLDASKRNDKIPLTWWYLGMTYLDNGNLQDGIAAVTRARELGYRFDSPDRYADAIRLYEKLVKLQPDDATFNAALAEAYAHGGRIDDAVIYAKKAAKLNPAFEADARAVVESLGRKWE